MLEASTAAPILLLATARHDLLEERPQWGERAGATRLVLRPLSDEAAAQVVENLLARPACPATWWPASWRPPKATRCIVEQMLSMLIDGGVLRQADGGWVRGDGDSEIAVPPTIHALLEARLDNWAARSVWRSNRPR